MQKIIVKIERFAKDRDKKSQIQIMQQKKKRN